MEKGGLFSEVSAKGGVKYEYIDTHQASCRYLYRVKGTEHREG